MGEDDLDAAPPAATAGRSQRSNGTGNGQAATANGGQDDEDTVPVGPTPSIVPGEEREEDCIKARPPV